MRRYLLRSAIGLVAIATVAAALVQRAGSASLAAVAAFARQQEAQWRNRDFDREPLSGGPTDGSAFAHYGTALQLTQQLGQQVSDRARQLRTQPEQVPAAAAAALLQQFAPALAALRAGAHCRDARTPIVWRQGFANHTQNLLLARELVNAAVLAGKQLRADGRDREAVELLLDAATFGSDLMSSPLLIDQMIGAALTAIASSEAWDDASLRRLDPAALQLLDQGLARLDARCPRALDLTGETLLLANTVLYDPAALQANGLSPEAWRYAGSTRWAMADAVLLEARANAGLAATAASPWPQRERQMLEILGAPELQQNPTLAIALPNLQSAELSLRQTLTLVRLLRCAVAWRLGERSLQLADPLGDGPLSVQQDQGSVHFVSAGVRQHQRFERIAAD